MLLVAHWLVSSPWAHLAEMLLILLGALATGPRGRRGGLESLPASTSTNPVTGGSLIRPTTAASSSPFTRGAVSEGEGFPLTRHRASSGSALGWSGSGMPGHGANGEPPVSAGYGDSA